MKTSGVYFQYKEDPYLTWISATSHLYNKTGEYTISVEAVNSVGSVTREKTIHVYGNGPHIFFFWISIKITWIQIVKFFYLINTGGGRLPKPPLSSPGAGELLGRGGGAE